MRFVSYKYVAVFIALGLMSALLGNTSSAESAKEKTLTLKVAELKKQNVDIANRYTGYITPIKSVALVPNVSGYIDEVWAEGGQTVAIGDNLVLIDQRQYKAELDAAKASIAQAKADFINAQTYYNRMKKAGEKAISASSLDQAKAQFLASQASLNQAKANAQKAQTMFDYTVLQAPISGIIGNVNLTKGNYVAPGGEPLLSIIQFDPIRVMFAISDKEYLTEIKQNPDGKLFSGETINIKLASGDIYPLQGKFAFADNQVDKSTDSVSVFVDFENPNRQLLANSYVDVIIGRKLNDVYLIRQNYATLNTDGAFINTIQNGKIKKTPFNIIGYLGDFYVTDTQFAKDEYVIIDKLGRIAQGTTVKLQVVNPATEDK